MGTGVEGHGGRLSEAEMKMILGPWTLESQGRVGYHLDLSYCTYSLRVENIQQVTDDLQWLFFTS